MKFDRGNYILTGTPLKKDLLKLFKQEDELIILDIGGCEGEESIRYSRLFPNSKIYIFEPLPSNQELIRKNILKFNIKNINLVPVALSDKRGNSEFYVSSGHPKNQPKDLDWDFGNKSSSLLEPEMTNIHDWLEFKNKIVVPTMTLDYFLKENKIEKVDFIHMDVQGAELKVLEGVKQNLDKIKLIWLEVADVSFYKNQALRVDIENFMKKNNFSLIKTVKEGKAGDQLYIRKVRRNIFGLFLSWFKLLIK